MANDVIQFVDSIAASPTVRLDLNDGTVWRTRLSAPPPALRRAVSANTMRDGDYVSTSTYGDRTLTLDGDLISSTQDLNATQLQLLARELDRDTNIIRYQPNGATSPVFFRTKRADYTVAELVAALAYRQPLATIPAEPFALGLRETISVGTVSNDPAAGSNGCYFDVTTVKGDVAAPMVFVDTGTLAVNMLLAVKQDALAGDFPTVFQAESAVGVEWDTSNPGGGPDAAMSGSGTNNFLRTTFATHTELANRVTVDGASTAAKKAMRGSHRVLVGMRRASATGAMTACTYRVVNDTAIYGPTVTIPASTARQLVDLGLVTIGVGDEIDPVNSPATGITLFASSASGADLDWDCIFLVPADAAMCLLGVSTTFAGGHLVLDGDKGAAYSVSNAANIYSTGTVFNRQVTPVGSVPMLKPGVTNRFVYHKFDASTPAYSKSVTGTVAIHYNPRYLFIRPATT